MTMSTYIINRVIKKPESGDGRIQDGAEKEADKVYAARRLSFQ